MPYSEDTAVLVIYSLWGRMVPALNTLLAYAWFVAVSTCFANLITTQTHQCLVLGRYVTPQDLQGTKLLLIIIAHHKRVSA